MSLHFKTDPRPVLETDTMNVFVALKQKNIDFLKRKVVEVSEPDSPGYGQYMTRDQILSIVSPAQTEKQPVYDWLFSNNVKAIQDMGDALMFVTASSNADTFNQAPHDLSDIVDFTIVQKTNPKLSPRINPRFRPKINVKATSPDVDNGYCAREVILRNYNMPNTTVGTDTSIGSIEYQRDSGFSQKDLLLTQKLQSIDPQREAAHIIGPDVFPDGESQLDVQMMVQTAAESELWYWDSKDWLYVFAVNFFNRPQIPHVISMSWGWAVDQQCSIASCSNSTQYTMRVNNEYAKIALRGVTITVSSGDAGAPGRTSEGCDTSRPVNPVLPGSSPYITSVGATYFVASNKTFDYKTPLCRSNACANGTVEQTISNDNVGWTAGGGFGPSFEPTPYWQEKHVIQYLKSGIPLPSNFSFNGRAYPDVTMVGHSCPVFTGGMLSGEDGTSCSSPLFAAVIGFLNSHQTSQGKPRLGFVNPVLYKMYDTDPTIFNDITTGHNWCTEETCCPTRKDGGSDFGYSSTEGYDPVTGLGSPNVRKMMQWLDKHI